jgi:hypothetical protein
VRRQSEAATALWIALRLGPLAGQLEGSSKRQKNKPANPKRRRRFALPAHSKRAITSTTSVRDSEHQPPGIPSVIPFNLQNSQDIHPNTANRKSRSARRFQNFITEKIEGRRARALTRLNRHNLCAFERCDRLVSV